MVRLCGPAFARQTVVGLHLFLPNTSVPLFVLEVATESKNGGGHPFLGAGSSSRDGPLRMGLESALWDTTDFSW